MCRRPTVALQRRENGVNLQEGHQIQNRNLEGNMRGQGQRLRPTAERKGRGEIQPNRAGGGYDLTDSALHQWESSELLRLRGCDQSQARINPRTIQGRLVCSNTRICRLVRTKTRSGVFFNHTEKEWSNEFTRAISHNNPHSDWLSIIYDNASISPTNPALKSRNKHTYPVILQDSAPNSLHVAAG